MILFVSLCCFFVYAYGDHRDLPVLTHSFPTRRSSDLSPFGLSGHHALITGGGSGLGRAATRCMREAGAAVTIVGTDAAKLARARAELGDVSAMAFDVTAVEAAEGFAARVADRHGPVSDRESAV